MVETVRFNDCKSDPVVDSVTGKNSTRSSVVISSADPESGLMTTDDSV